MSVLQYGPVRMQIQSTEHFRFGPVMSEDGVDYTVTELDFGVTAVVNQQSLATLGATQIAGANQQFFDDAPAQANGDRLGISLQNLRAMLLTPRQALTFSIGGDNVVTIPAGGDARQGPIPQRDTRVEWISGIASARIYFHVKCWLVEWVPPSGGVLNTLPHVVLSNRFRVSSSMDGDFYTRRQVAGQMIIDPSKLALFAGLPGGAGVLSPDNFRAAAFLQIPLGFRREDVQVTVSSDNTVLDYSYADQETPLALGLRSMATEIHATATAGIVDTLNSVGAVGAAAAAVAEGAAAVADPIGVFRTGLAALGGLISASGFPAIGAAIGGGDLGGTAARAVGIAAGEGLPKIAGSGVARVKGQRNATKDQLVQLAINILIDRFTTQANNFGAFFAPNNQPRIGKITIQQDVVERSIEVAIGFIPRLFSPQGQIANVGGNIAGNAIGLMNLNTQVNTQGAAGTDPLLTGQLAQANPPPPNSNNTRGNWVGALVVSLLATPGLPPALPLDPAVNVDLAAFI